MLPKRKKTARSDDEVRVSKLIFDALGTQLKVSTEAKNNFSNTVAAELGFWQLVAKQSSEKRENFQDLVDASKNAEKAMRGFNKQLQNNLDASALYLEYITGHGHPDISAVLGILKHFNARIKKLKGPTKNTKEAMFLAKQIGRFYKKTLQKNPSSNKATDLSPYERVCEVISKELQIEIRKPTMNKAVKDLRSNP